MTTVLALAKSIEGAPLGAKENLGKAWVLLGDKLRMAGPEDNRTTFIHESRVTAADCFANGLNLMDRTAKAAATVWRDLADSIELAHSEDPAAAENDDDGDDGAEPACAPPAAYAIVESIPHSVTTCRCRSVEADPKSSELWVLLGQRLSALASGEASAVLPEADANDEEETARVQQAAALEEQALRRVRELWAEAAGAPSSGSPLTAMNCFVMVLNNDVAFTDAWFFVADEMIKIEEREGMAPGTLKARIVGKEFAAWQCLIEGLKRDPKGYASAWLDLAKAIPRDKTSVRVGNNAGEFTRLQCIIQSLAIDDANASAWLALGLLLIRSKETGDGATAVKHNGRTYRPLDCFVRAVELDMECAEAWVSLAAELRSRTDGAGDEPPRTVDVNDVAIRALDAYLAALRINGGLAGAWDGLGMELNALGAGSTCDVTIAGGIGEAEVTEVDAMDCIKRAVTLEPEEGAYWHHLARAMPTGGAIEINEWQRSQIDCFAEALRLDPDDHDAWMDMAEALPRGGVAKVGDRAVAPLRCYAEAVRTNPQNPVAWANVGALLMPGATIAIADQLTELTQIDCYVKSLRLARRQPDVWRNLAAAILATKDAANQDFGSDDEGPDGEPLPAHERERPEVVTEVDVFGDGEMFTAERCVATAADLEAA